jgi:PilZ domain
VNPRSQNPEANFDKRSEPRHVVHTAATVDVLGDQPFSLPAEVVNVSARGMRLVLAEPIVADAALRIHLGLDQYLGEVTYCGRDGDRYFVGIELINVMRNAAAVSEHFQRILLPR